MHDDFSEVFLAIINYFPDDPFQSKEVQKQKPVTPVFNQPKLLGHISYKSSGESLIASEVDCSHPNQFHFRRLLPLLRGGHQPEGLSNGDPTLQTLYSLKPGAPWILNYFCFLKWINQLRSGLGPKNKKVSSEVTCSLKTSQ